MTVQFGRYALKRRIAVGGMAEIFIAEAPGIAGFKKTVALKLILPELAEDGEHLGMFFDEAKLVSAMVHPNIAQVLELGQVSGRYFIAMEYVPGIDLAKLLRQLANVKEALEPPVALAIMLDVLAGLHFAHVAKSESGEALYLVHRDVSPHNVLLSRDGEVKLTDFGIAKAATREFRTRTGFVKGKFSYMSPEQASGQVIDRRSDVYSAGLVLYELLTGERAYGGGDELAIMEAARKGTVRSISVEPPAPLRDVLSRALAFDPSARFATAEAFREALAALPSVPAPREALAALVRRFAGEEAIEEDETLEAIGLTSAERPTPRPKRRAAYFGIAGIGLLAIAGIAVVVWFSRPVDQEPVPLAEVHTSPPPVAEEPSPEQEDRVPEVPEPDEPEPKRRAIGWLTVNAQPWAYVSIDGKRLASPTPVRRHPLRIGRHQVHLVSPSLGVEEDRIVEVRAGKTTQLFHQFSAR